MSIICYGALATDLEHETLCAEDDPITHDIIPRDDAHVVHFRNPTSAKTGYCYTGHTSAQHISNQRTRGLEPRDPLRNTEFRNDCFAKSIC